MKNKHLPVDLLTVIKRPVITEKSTKRQELNQYTFVVDTSATKQQIKQAVEQLFEIKVKAVNTLITKGKKTIFKGRVGTQSDVKKAYVTLVEKPSFDLTTGI